MRSIIEREKGIFYPYIFFLIFRDIFGFDKGVLLLPRAKQGVFLPASALGLSTSTIGTLFFNQQELHTMGTRRLISADDPVFAGKFSQSDLQNLNSLIYLPLNYQQNTHGILLCNQPPTLNYDEQILNAILGGLGVSAGHGLYTERNLLNSTPNMQYSDSEQALAFPFLPLGVMAQDASTSLLGALPQALEADFLHQCALLCQAYKPLYARKQHRLYLQTLPDDPQDQRILMTTILRTIQNQWSHSIDNHGDIGNYYSPGNS
jgi:hypothetical protein